MNFVIITDGNSKLGMGHVYQSITLAKTLINVKYTDVNISFISKSEKPILELIAASGFEVLCLSNDDLIFEELNGRRPDRIVFDKLDVSPDLARRIKEKLQIKLVIFTNITEANIYADVTVMAGMGSNFANICEKNNVNDKVRFWGPKYWLLRPEFYSFKPKNFNSNIKKILLIFGGADHANLSSVVLNELMQMEEEFQITIILGAAFSYHKELQIVLKRNIDSKSSIVIIKKLVEVAETMYDNDLVCVSPGLSFFEALAVSTPVLCFHQNEFQENAWKGHIKTYDKVEVTLIPELIRNNRFIFYNDREISQMEIGKGFLEVIDEILN